MIAQNLAKHFPFAANYFSELFSFSYDRFPQSIVFEGADVYAQCFFALELARILNCENNGDENCQCLNCRWIRSNTHPAVNFVSQLHFKPSNDESKTVISAIQAKEIEKSLRMTSDYHRFFIFFDAKTQAPDKMHLESINKFMPKDYGVFGEPDWSMGHINQKTFNPSTPNVLLKSVEEPPKRTTFVFLTRNRSDLINTIVSRSQIFKLPCAKNGADISKISEIFASYPDITYETAFEISDKIQNYIKEDDTSASVVLDEILGYLIECSKAGMNLKVQRDIKYVSVAKKWIQSSVSDKMAFDTLMLKIARNV